MVDEVESQEPEPIETQETSSPETEQSEPQPTGLNPVFEPIRQELGLQFEAIRPKLLEIEKNFNEHVTKTNAKYSPWKQFDEQGVNPDQVTAAFTALQKLNDNPEEIYTALGQFLEENGRLPKNAKEAEEALEAVDEEDDEYTTPESKKIRELEKQLKDFQALVTGQGEQAQQAAEAARQEALNVRAEQQVAQEYTAFQTAHPNLDPADWQEIQRRHYLYALQGPEHMKSLDEVGKEFFALTERIRSAPRPTDLAPRLPGAGGAVPAGQHKDPSEFSREESQDALADLLIRSKQS